MPQPKSGIGSTCAAKFNLDFTYISFYLYIGKKKKKIQTYNWMFEIENIKHSLEFLQIIKCPQLESFLEGGLLSNLISLAIEGSKKLISTRMEWGSQRLQSLK